MNFRQKLTGLVACVLLASCGDQQPSVLRVGNALYRFPIRSVDFIREDGSVPADYVHVDSLPSPDKTGVEFLRFVSGEKDGKPTRQRVMLVYHGRKKFPLSRFYNHTAATIRKPWGMVLCDRESIELGMFYTCGIKLTVNGADWEVLFDHSRLTESTDMAVEARKILSEYRVSQNQK